MIRRALLPLLLALPTAAAAQDRDFCADRPGLGTPACTMAPGRVMLEAGALGWQHAADAASVEDDLTWGDMLLRVGVDERTEIELGLTGLVTTRVRDRASGLVSRDHGVGDATLAVRRSLSGPDGPIALHGFVTLPTGKAGIGAGDWGAGVMMPMGFQLPGGFELGLTPEADAAVNSSGKGRHFAWGGVAGLAHPLGKALSLESEVGAWRDLDPAGHATEVDAAASLAWQAGRDWQVDVEADVGLTSSAPRHALLLGFAHRF